jgi:monofunctional biosynthetic peptidoglycan transglycosylase
MNPPFTAVTVLNWIRHNGAARQYQPKSAWQALKKISPHLRKAVLAGEDQRFLSHHGFDFKELNQAIKDMALKRGARGASTITMQVARTVFLWPNRSWLRKAAEAYYTVLIEIFWSKERILEIYLNTVDWGSGLMGAEAASGKYFNRTSASISRPQAALLAAILPSPDKWSPTNPSAYVSMRQKAILRDMKRMPLLS